MVLNNSLRFFGLIFFRFAFILICVVMPLTAVEAAEIVKAFSLNAAGSSGEQIDLNYKNCVIIRRSYELISIYWRCLDALNKIKESSCADDSAVLHEKYNRLCAEMNEAAVAMSNYIIEDISKNNDFRALKTFSNFYKSKAIYERQPLYLVCTPLIKKIECLILHEPVNFMVDGSGAVNGENFEKQYFPGYGEADPIYYYRKGRELESEVIDTYWKEVTNSYTQYETIQSEVTHEHLFDMYDDCDIDIIEQQGPFEKIIDGVPVVYYKVKFMTLATVSTVSKRKYNLTRIWFELLRNKYSILMPSKWEACGKTYEMHELYTGCELIIK